MIEYFLWGAALYILIGIFLGIETGIRPQWGWHYGVVMVFLWLPIIIAQGLKGVNQDGD